MELKICYSENEDNKENTPPNSPEENGPDTRKLQCCTKRRLRLPLRDVTYFYNSSVQFKDFQMPSTISVSSITLNNRKRKAADEKIDSIHKILRKEFR